VSDRDGLTMGDWFWTFVILMFLVLLFSCGPSNYTPPTPTPPADNRLSVAQLGQRQTFAANNIVLYPRRRVQPYQWAVREIVNGGAVAIADLEPDYWRFPLVVHLHYQGQPGAEDWFRGWLETLPNYRKWSLNHQEVRAIGRYFHALITGNNLPQARERVLDVVNGPYWWDESGRELIDRHPSAGEHRESFASRHYSPRCIEYLWVLADYGEPDIAKAAAVQLDIAISMMRIGMTQGGILDERLVPRFRANKDSVEFAEAWHPWGLTAHPGQTPVLLYMLFGTEWRYEFQSVDQSHEQWMSATFLLGKNWRPLK